MAASCFAGRAILVTGAGTVAAIEQAGGRAIGLTRDLSVREAMQDAVASFAAEAGRLDGLVNNAA